MRLGSAAYADPQVVMSDDGQALVVWTQETRAGYRLAAAERTGDGGAWSAVRALTSFQPGLVESFDVAMNQAGQVVVAYTQHQALWLLRRSTDGTWWSPGRLTRPHAVADAPSVALDSTGTASLVWAQLRQHKWAIFARTQSPEGTWSTRNELSVGPGNAALPQVAADDHGHANVSWSIVHRGRAGWVGKVQFARSTSGRWGRTRVLASADARLYAPLPLVVTAPSGWVMVTWSAHRGDRDVVWSTIRRSGSGWGSVRRVTYGLVTDLALGEDGTAVATWERRVWRPPGTSRCGVSVRPPGAAWGAGRVLSAPGVATWAPLVDVGGGNVTIAWDADTNIQAIQRTDGTWGPVVDFLPDHQGGAQDVAMDSTGAAVLAFRHGAEDLPNLLVSSKAPG